MGKNKKRLISSVSSWKSLRVESKLSSTDFECFILKLWLVTWEVGMPSTKAENSKQTLGPENLSQYLIVLVFDLGSVTLCYGAVPS